MTIYIDPPFDVGADFTMDDPIGDEKETVCKDQSTLEMVAYRDMWGNGTDSYLHMMYERLALMFAARLRRAANGASCFASACSSGHRRWPFEQSLERLAA